MGMSEAGVKALTDSLKLSAKWFPLPLVLLESITEWCKLGSIYCYLRKKVKGILRSYHHKCQCSTLAWMMIIGMT